jgi:hypothetical protein
MAFCNLWIFDRGILRTNSCWICWREVFGNSEAWVQPTFSIYPRGAWKLDVFAICGTYLESTIRIASCWTGQVTSFHFFTILNSSLLLMPCWELHGRTMLSWGGDAGHSAKWRILQALPEVKPETRWAVTSLPLYVPLFKGFSSFIKWCFAQFYSAANG